MISLHSNEQQQITLQTDQVFLQLLQQEILIWLEEIRKSINVGDDETVRDFLGLPAFLSHMTTFGTNSNSNSNNNISYNSHNSSMNNMIIKNNNNSNSGGPNAPVNNNNNSSPLSRSISNNNISNNNNNKDIVIEEEEEDDIDAYIANQALSQERDITTTTNNHNYNNTPLTSTTSQTMGILSFTASETLPLSLPTTKVLSTPTTSSHPTTNTTTNTINNPNEIHTIILEDGICKIQWKGTNLDNFYFVDQSKELNEMYKDCSHSHGFKVRGPHYMKDKKKIEASPAIGKLVYMDCLSVNTEVFGDRHDHVARIPLVRHRIDIITALEDHPFVFLINFQVFII
jgi:hypothetical protein